MECTYLTRNNNCSTEEDIHNRMISQIRRIDKLNGYSFMHLIDTIDSNGATEIAMEILRFKGLV